MPHLQTSVQGQISEACYAKSQYRYAEDGKTVLNELGLPAKPGDIILRAANGYPLVRAGQNRPMMVDLKTGKIAEEA